MGSVSGSKAYFENIDQGGRVYVQFNPKEFKVNDKANWKASDEHEASDPLLTYEKGDPSTISMELIFDGTDTGSDVFAGYVEPLRGFLSATVDDKDSEGNKMKRPPYCKFVWGSINFDCVVDSLNATAIMFNAAGGVLRARVTVNLKERQVEEHRTSSTAAVTLSSMGSFVTGGAVTTRTVSPGQTLSSVAPDNWREVAAVNGISDPMSPPPGQVVIPLNSDLAAVLAGQHMRYHPNKWVGDPAIEDYGGPYRGPSAQSGGSSAFEDRPAGGGGGGAARSGGGGGGGGSAAAGPGGSYTPLDLESGASAPPDATMYSALDLSSELASPPLSTGNGGVRGGGGGGRGGRGGRG